MATSNQSILGLSDIGSEMPEVDSAETPDWVYEYRHIEIDDDFAAEIQAAIGRWKTPFVPPARRSK